jgi:predicted XRE-type DNA-binding protein
VTREISFRSRVVLCSWNEWITGPGFSGSLSIFVFTHGRQNLDIIEHRCHTAIMAWTVILLDEVTDWYLDLIEREPRTAGLVEAAIDVLAAKGPRLGRPLAERITGSRIHNLKELRPGSVGQSEIRILFVFDPARHAILLMAGDKAGDWSGWYRDNIPLAEQRYERWLAGGYDEERNMRARNWKDVRAEGRAKGLLDDAEIAEHRRRMLAELRAYQLSEIREALGLNQTGVADLLGVSQSRVSRIERGDLDHTEIATVRAYVGALGGEVEIVARFGDERITIG